MQKTQTFTSRFSDILNTDSNLIKFCEGCGKEFSLIRLRHNCKRCDRKICSSCGKTRRTVVTYDLKSTHKVCPVCEKEDSFQFTFRNLNQTKWGYNSIFGNEIKKMCEIKAGEYNGSDVPYQELLKRIKESKTIHKDDFDIIHKDVMSGRSDRAVFNYSLQSFLHYNQEGESQIEIRTQMANVLKAFCIRFPNIGYCQGMNYIVAMLLSIMDEESAYLVFGHMINKILPKNFYAKTTQGSALMGFQQEKFVLWRLANDYLKLDENLSESVKNFLDMRGPSFLIPLFVNYLNFQVLVSVWKRMFRNQSMNELRRISLGIIEMLLSKIKLNDIYSNSCDLQSVIVNEFTIEVFDKVQKIDIDDAQIAAYEEEFKRDFSAKWASNDSYVHFTLQKHTHFKINEIKSLQEEFRKSVSDGATGINKTMFRQIIYSIVPKEKTKSLEIIDFDQMFDVFDLDATGDLDFKEFLFAVSMLTRGNLAEKVEFAFQVFDKEGKGYLDPESYKKFVSSMIHASIFLNNYDTDSFKATLFSIEEKLLHLAKTKDRIKFIEIQNFLVSEQFIDYFDTVDGVRERGGTVAKIKNSLSKTHPKESEREVISEVEEGGSYSESGSSLKNSANDKSEL